MNATRLWRRISTQVAFFIFLLGACQKDNEILNSFDTQNVNSESASAALVSENSDISATVVGGLTNTQYAGARTEADTVKNLVFSDGRLKCATVTVIRTGTKDAPAGTIIIDYGTSGSCTDNQGVVRKGKIVVTYSGMRWIPGSVFTIELVDFYRNSAHIEGTEKDSTTLRIDSLHLTFISKLTGGKVTFGDGKTIERNHTFQRTWYRSSILLNNEWHITGNASGKNKNGDTYEMEIQSPLVHKLSCWINKRIFIPVKGVKVITIMGAGSKTYKVDFGDGSCDNQITVVVGGKEKVITVTPDGN